MSRWVDDAIRQLEPKREPVKDSWWTRPDVAQNREAFQRQLVATEIQRMNASQRFGGAKKLLDKFPMTQKKSQR